MSITPTFSGEVQFRRYSDTSTQGQQIVLALADREALSAFIGKEGKRFMAVLVEVGDDEQPVPPQPKAQPAAPKGGPLARLAGQWCQDASFIDWLTLHHHLQWSNARAALPDEAPDDWAAHCLRVLCGIESRAELDHRPEAAERFQRLVRRPYRAHCGLAG